MVFDRVCRNHAIMDKKMEELEVILSYDLISDIEEIVVSNTDPLKRIYLKYRLINVESLNSDKIFTRAPFFLRS